MIASASPDASTARLLSRMTGRIRPQLIGEASSLLVSSAVPCLKPIRRWARASALSQWPSTRTSARAREVMRRAKRKEGDEQQDRSRERVERGGRRDRAQRCGDGAGLRSSRLRRAPRRQTAPVRRRNRSVRSHSAYRRRLRRVAEQGRGLDVPARQYQRREGHDHQREQARYARSMSAPPRSGA